MRKHLPLIVSLVAVVLFFAAVLTVYFTMAAGPAEEAEQDITEESEEVFDSEAQREAYYSAVEKTEGMSFSQYSEKMTSLITLPDRQETDSLSGELKIINRGKEDPRYYGSFTRGDEAWECWYMNGMGYTDESGEKLKASLDEEAFGEYIDGKIFLALGDEFYRVEAVKNDDGTCSVTFDGLSRVPDEVTRMYYDLGMTDLKISGFSGAAEIDDKGRLTEQSIVLKLSMMRAGDSVTGEYRSEVSFEAPGQKFALTPPSVAEFTEIGSIFAPGMIKRAYENFMYHSYTASYETNYLYSEGEKDTAYSMKLGYKAETDQANGFKAQDETVVKYDLKKNDSTSERSTSYSGGTYTSVNGGSTDTRSMDEDKARSTYYHKLLDYLPGMDEIEAITVKDNGSSYELSYTYTEKRTREFCQAVLISVISDEHGIAINSEDHTVSKAEGILCIDKDTGTIKTHSIKVDAVFNDGKTSHKTVFEHSFKLDMVK